MQASHHTGRLEISVPPLTINWFSRRGPPPEVHSWDFQNASMAAQARLQLAYVHSPSSSKKNLASPTPAVVKLDWFDDSVSGVLGRYIEIADARRRSTHDRRTCRSRAPGWGVRLQNCSASAMAEWLRDGQSRCRSASSRPGPWSARWECWKVVEGRVDQIIIVAHPKIHGFGG